MKTTVLIVYESPNGEKAFPLAKVLSHDVFARHTTTATSTATTAYHTMPYRLHSHLLYCNLTLYLVPCIPVPCTLI